MAIGASETTQGFFTALHCYSSLFALAKKCAFSDPFWRERATVKSSSRSVTALAQLRELT
jgi:hypothetical protein